MTVFEMAQKYYPDYWSKDRLDTLVEAGKLTKAEVKNIISAALEKEAENEIH